MAYHWRTESLPILQDIPEQAKSILLRDSSTATCGSQSYCWREGQKCDAFVFVMCGEVKLEKQNPAGRSTILSTRRAGDLLCPLHAQCGGNYCCNAIAMESGTTTARFARNTLIEQSLSHPALGRKLQTYLRTFCEDHCDRITDLTCGQVDRRIIALLLRLSERSGVVRTDGQVHLPIPLTRQDIADMTGATVETTIRVLSLLRKQHLVLSAQRGFLLPSLASSGATDRCSRRNGCGGINVMARVLTSTGGSLSAVLKSNRESFGSNCMISETISPRPRTSFNSGLYAQGIFALFCVTRRERPACSGTDDR